MVDVVAMGDAVYDMTPAGVTDGGRTLYERMPGGSAANVACFVSRLGRKGAYIGAVSDDAMGRSLMRELADAGLETGGIRFTSKGKTTVAIVALDDQNNRSFVMYPGYGMAADAFLEPDALEMSLLEECSVFHYSIPAQMQAPTSLALEKALEYVKGHGKLVSYDPNIRPYAWRDMDEAVRRAKEAFTRADILKLSAEEFEFFTGSSDYRRDSVRLMDLGVRVLCVTLGSMGCFFRTESASCLLPAYDVPVVDTTGAGDAFLGALLYRIVTRGGLDGLGREEMEDVIRFANAAGSLCTMHRGAIAALPTYAEIMACLRG